MFSIVFWISLEGAFRRAVSNKKIEKCTPGCIEASEKTKKTRSSYQLAGDDSLTFFTLLGKRVSAVQGVALPFHVSC